MTVQQLIDRLEADRAQIDAALAVLRRCIGAPNDQPRPVHWTQRPENAAKLRQTVDRMTRARVNKLRRATK